MVDVGQVVSGDYSLSPLLVTPNLIAQQTTARLLLQLIVGAARGAFKPHFLPCKSAALLVNLGNAFMKTDACLARGSGLI